MFHPSFGVIVSLRHAWLFEVRPRYHMTYTLIGIGLLVHWYHMTSINKTFPNIDPLVSPWQRQAPYRQYGFMHFSITDRNVIQEKVC